jgi:tetratricopeptide (TPR) repeat protein
VGESIQDSRDERDPLKRKIAVTLAAVVVLGGGLAILQTKASVNESNTARETTRLAVRAMGANVRLDSMLGVQSDLEAERVFLPFRRPLNVAGAREVRAATNALPPTLGQRQLDRLRLDSQRQSLGQQALATTRVAWNTRATAYHTVIALLAAALFLVGFGLIVEGSIRKYSYAVGVSIALFAVGWGAWLYQLSIPSTSTRALDRAARAAVFTADGDYRSAIGMYGRAIAADDDYEAAYSGRARARLLAANPDYGSSRAITAPELALAAAVHDAERAVDLGGKRDLLAHALVALVSFYQGDYQQATRELDDALAINARVPDVWLLKSATQAALGDEQRAGESLTRALGLLAGAQPSQRIRGLASSYLTYLARVTWRNRPSAGISGRLARRVVAAETSLTLRRRLSRLEPPRGQVRVEGLRYAAGRLMFTLHWQKLPKGTALSALGYERPQKAGAWVQAPDLALFVVLGATGTRHVGVQLRRVCRPTAVRVDLYLNGAPASLHTAPGVRATC